MTKKAYKVLAKRVVRGVALASQGDTVYDYAFFDGGAAESDARITGKPHTSVTKNENGGAPSFSMPTEDLLPILITPGPIVPKKKRG